MAQTVKEVVPTPPGDAAEQAQYKRAEQRVEAIRGFYIHLGIYLIVNLFLFALNMVTNSHNLWFYWPLIGWGIAVAINAFVVFGADRFLGARWEEEKIREELGKQ